MASSSSKTFPPSLSSPSLFPSSLFTASEEFFSCSSLPLSLSSLSFVLESGMLPERVGEKERAEEGSLSLNEAALSTFSNTNHYSCRLCNVTRFESVQEQRAHFQTLWHKENIKRSLEDLPPLSLHSFSSENISATNHNQVSEPLENSSSEVHPRTSAEIHTSTETLEEVVGKFEESREEKEDDEGEREGRDYKEELSEMPKNPEEDEEAGEGEKEGEREYPSHLLSDDDEEDSVKVPSVHADVSIGITNDDVSEDSVNVSKRSEPLPSTDANVISSEEAHVSTSNGREDTSADVSQFPATNKREDPSKGRRRESEGGGSRREHERARQRLGKVELWYFLSEGEEERRGESRDRGGRMKKAGEEGKGPPVELETAIVKPVSVVTGSNRTSVVRFLVFKALLSGNSDKERLQSFRTLKFDVLNAPDRADSIKVPPKPGKASSGGVQKSEMPDLGRIPSMKGSRIWIVLLNSGGHFAAIALQLEGGVVLKHQTFHRYVVRAKAGGRQSTSDNSLNCSAISAGSTLRRYNEAALTKDIARVLSEWDQPFIQLASLIFIFAPSSSNSSPIYQVPKTGKAAHSPNVSAPSGNRGQISDLPPLSQKWVIAKTDPRVRKIPFPVGRPTYGEARRVAKKLAGVEILETVGAQELVRRLSAVEKLESCKVQETDSKLENGEIGKLERERGGVQSVTREKEEAERGEKRRDERGENGAREGGREGELRGGGKEYPLHVASESGDVALIHSLLSEGADPSERNERGKTAYALARDKEARNAFRKFMNAFPNKWDWKAADVPSALSEEMEAAQNLKKAEKDAKRKAKLKERKQKEKEKLKSEKIKEAVDSVADSSSFQPSNNSAKGTSAPTLHTGNKGVGNSKISEHERVRRDRELRAAAAERRLNALKNMAPDEGGNWERCDWCKDSLAGKTPFHRYEYKYCSVACVNHHRMEVLEK